MQFQAKATDSLQATSQCLVVGIFADSLPSETARRIDQAGKEALSKLMAAEQFTGKAGQTLLLHHPAGTKAQRMLLLGLGKAGTGAISEADFNKAAEALSNQARQLNAGDMLIDLVGVTVSERNQAWQYRQITQALATGLWRFDRFKSDKPKAPALKKVTFASPEKPARDLKNAVSEGEALALGINYARELGNLPGNVCTPSYLASEARKLGRGESKLKVSVLGEKQMRELGMNALLSVSAGSVEPAKLIVMEYQGTAKAQKPYALVGKGITFDTGGISIKPAPAMDEMKFDMCGAASVFGTMKTLLALKPAINVVAIVAAAENMPSGSATKPGDIVTSMSGQTIEILNTDAEGRLVLCDALTYCARYKPRTVVDIATLTGACVIALGNHAHGLYSNTDALANELLAAGQRAGDRAWQMPLWDEYQKSLDSNFADMANVGGREAGSVTAACFLSRFTRDMQWAHLDIAGTAWKSGAAKGATGRPVGLLVNYLLSQL